MFHQRNAVRHESWLEEQEFSQGEKRDVEILNRKAEFMNRELFHEDLTRESHWSVERTLISQSLK